MIKKIINSKNLFIFVDVESTGSIPNKFSMYEYAAIALINENKQEQFYSKVELVNNNYNPDALKAMNLTIEQLKNRKDVRTPLLSMTEFESWINAILKKYNKDRAIFISDNLAFDWQWINYYFHYYLERNPFGFSGRRIGDIYSGLSGNISDHSSWKKMRVTKHDHNPLNDCLGNVEAFLKILQKF